MRVISVEPGAGRGSELLSIRRPRPPIAGDFAGGERHCQHSFFFLDGMLIGRVQKLSVVVLRNRCVARYRGRVHWWIAGRAPGRQLLPTLNTKPTHLRPVREEF